MRNKGLHGVTRGTRISERKLKTNPSSKTRRPSSHEIQPEILTRWYGTIFQHFCCALKFWACGIICFSYNSKTTFRSFIQSTQWQILQLWKYANQLQLPFSTLFVVRLAAKSKEPVLRRKSSSKITPFRRQFLIQKKDLKTKTLHLQQFLRPYLDIYVEFFSLCLRWTCLSHFLTETGIAFLNLARLCWVIQLYTAGPASPTSEIFRKHRSFYRDYKGLHGLIRVTGDTGVTTLGYKVTRLNRVYLCVYRVYVRVYMVYKRCI